MAAPRARFDRKPLVNDLTWSKSRHEKLAECPRSYYYQYYGSWGGWERSAPADVRELYLLKKLTARFAWVGSSVHDAIKRALTVLRQGQTPDVDALITFVRERMREEFRESRGGEYRRRKAFGLVEHEYKEPVAPEDWLAGWKNTEACLRAFFASRWASLAAGLDEQDWLPIDELGSFEFEGVKIFAAPDFAFRAGDRVEIVDWKTGLPRDSDKEQLLGYALFAHQSWNVPLERITGRVVYLPSMSEIEVAISPAEVEAFVARMRGSIAHMRSLLVDPEKNVAVVEAFPATGNELACGRCPFRRPCKA